MDEKQIIKQLKILRTIKPNKKWASLAKEEILEKETQSVSQWAFIPVGRPALVLAAVVLVAVVVAGGGFYLQGYRTPVVVYKNVEGLVAKIASQSQSNKQVVASLTELEDKLESISLSLEGLKNMKNPGQALAVAEIVKSTVKNGEETINRIKLQNGSLSKQVLASLDEVEDRSKELTERSQVVQKEIFESYLQGLKQRSLSEADRERLQRVEEYYKEGKTEEAMVLIMRIGQ